MKKSIFSRGGKRGNIFAAVTVGGILLLFALNLLLTYVGLHKTVFIDMTNEGFYTLTDKMADYVEGEILDKIPKDENGRTKPIEITFCADPDTLMANQVLRLPYVMSLKLSNEFEDIKVKTVNVNNDPTSVAMYKTTALSSIEADDIIVSYGQRYRISSARSFWTTAEDKLWSYNGEYKMASIIMSLTAVNQPVAYFLIGHGETYYDTENPEHEGNEDAMSVYTMLAERGLAVKTLDLSKVDEVPEDCVLLVLNNPTKDFEYDEDKLGSNGYVDELEKIDKFLTKGNASMMVSKDYSKELPNLEIYLREWGFVLSDNKVNDNGRYDNISGVYETDENSYGNAIYEDYASSASSPKMMFGNTGYISCAWLSQTMRENGADAVNRTYASFISSSDKSAGYKYNSETESYEIATGKMPLTLAAVCSRSRTNSDGTTTYSYVFCANSADFLSNKYLGNPSYANFDIIGALVNNMARTDLYASEELGGTSLNSSSFGGKQIIDQALHEEDTEIYSTDTSNLQVIKVNSGIGTASKAVISVFIYAIPLIIAIVGIVVCVKRKFL